MKILRSSKCSLKFSTQEKRGTLDHILKEYGRVVNFFIDLFWEAPVSKSKLLKPLVDAPKSSTWLSARFRKVAAREALDMILAAKEASKATGKKAVPPHHYGKRIACSSTIAELQLSDGAKEFDAWLHLSSIGEKIILDLPIRFHKHFLHLAAKGRRLNSYIITADHVQFCFEIETGEKREIKRAAGVDTGINHLITASSGKHYGSELKPLLLKIKACRHGSKRQARLRRALRQYMDETIILFFRQEDPDLVVLENLLGITKKTKGRALGPKTRYFLGSWNQRYYVERLKQQAECNRVIFRSVSPHLTSQMCSKCGHTERGNRCGEMFKCLRCGHTQHADKNAAINILERFLSGPYGAGCKEKIGKDQI